MYLRQCGNRTVPTNKKNVHKGRTSVVQSYPKFSDAIPWLADQLGRVQQGKRSVSARKSADSNSNSSCFRQLFNIRPCRACPAISIMCIASLPVTFRQLPATNNVKFCLLPASPTLRLITRSSIWQEFVDSEAPDDSMASTAAPEPSCRSTSAWKVQDSTSGAPSWQS
jgi:hypothetical protein